MAKENDKVKNGFFLGEDDCKKLVKATKECLKQMEVPYCWPTRRKIIDYSKFGANDIPKKTLERNQDEVQNVKEFCGYSKIFSQCDFTKNDIKTFDLHDSRQKVIFDVIKWGGTYDRDGKQSGEKNKGQDITRAVVNISKSLAAVENLYKNKDVGDTENVKEIVRIMNKCKVNIPTWSKILAAWKPGTFFIYDSRVSITLSHITLESGLPCFWKLLPPSDAENANFKTLKEKVKDNYFRSNAATKSNAATMSTCYDLYLKLLRRVAEDGGFRETFRYYSGDDNLDLKIQKAYEEAFKDISKTSEEIKTCAIMAHLEKMLFMMKEKILEETKEK